MFSERQIAMLQTFGDQAVIAIENVRLFKELEARNRDLTESLEQQTATSEILRVISSSPTDLKPVLDAVAESAARLCNAGDATLFRVEGDWLKQVGAHGPIPHVPAEESVPLRRDVISARAVMDRSVVHVADVLAESDAEYAGSKAYAGRLGYRTALAVPMLREGEAIGTILLRRPEVRPFSESQIGLVKTFADQAVIAIENTRLFNELESRNRDLTEALEQQTATSEILRVISSSPTDLQPVLDAVVESAARLCDASDALIFRVHGDRLKEVAQYGSMPSPAGEVGLPILRDEPSGRAVIDRCIVHVPDILAESNDEFGRMKDLAKRTGIRTLLVAPLLREGTAIGTIHIRRGEVRPFSEKQIALLQTFADQAVIAIENTRLFNELESRNRDLTESLEQQTATSEILRVISQSQRDVQPVFEAIAANALKLCRGATGAMYTFDGELIKVGAAHSFRPEGLEAINRTFPMPPGRGGAAARAVLTRAVVYIPDIREDPEYRLQGLAQATGYRSVLSVPMLHNGNPIGALSVTGVEPGMFTDRQIAMLQTFADQAVIAIENTRLFNELQARTEALSRSVGQLTALGEVGQAISSTLDLETVLKTIVARAVQLTGLDGGSIYEYDERAEVFRLQAAENMAQDLAEDIRRAPTRKGDGALGRTAITREPTQVPDTLDDSYQSGRKDLLIRTGWRALLAVPLLREDHLLGAILVNRNTPGPFAPEVVELLKTFATQSAMAIQNARLFREIADKGRQLEVASRHKSDFLASMSHELRTPLNAILGFNEMILGQVYGEVPADMKEPLTDIQASGKHLLRLINNVLDLAKIEAGRMELSLADYSVHDTVESVHSTLRPLAADKGLEFLATVPADIPLAHGDAGRIKQCLMNLAGNSLKFTKAGKVEISVELRDRRLVYRVADTGIGISPDKIETVFAEFKQSDATIASEYGGTGLGLSISRKFIEMHGGRIWVESELGKGSTFLFEIPLRVAGRTAVGAAA
jgi:GAF domain-containing protein/anti-sigma regulatory factor (Ser/Thr protein kinase)